MHVLTVSQLTHAIKLCMEATFPSIWLQGEISNFKEQSSGHLYFSLKDSQAQISAVMFRGDAVSLKALPKAGDHVIVRGELNVYPPKGNYQIIVRELSQVGLGELLVKLEQLKIKLHQMGWFSSEHKKPLPHLPKRIGIVTSPTGAAIQDILNILGRRFSGVHVILNPVKVQGEGAAREIAQAIEQFNRYQLADVLIVGRGGGSLEDLWAFNEEVVASAIFYSQIPIISAVGHETDHCIADYVADMRAPTPSAAAEIVIAEKAHHLKHLGQLQRELIQTMSHLIKQQRHRLQGIKRQPIMTSPYALIGTLLQKIDDRRFDVETAMTQSLMRKRMQLDAKHRQMHLLKPNVHIQHLRLQFIQREKRFLQQMQHKIETLKENLLAKHDALIVGIKNRSTHWRHLFSYQGKQRQLDKLWEQYLHQSKEKIKALHFTLFSIDPKNLLKKGYSIIFPEKEKLVINSVHALKRQEKIRILMSDGQATAVVIEKEPTKGNKED